MDPTSAPKNLVLSLVRTYVPYIVSAFAAWLASTTDFVIDEEMKTGLTLFVAGVVFGVYYLVVRLLETYVAPWFSFFLGDLRKGLTVPVYPDSPPPPAAVVQPAADGDA